jgi:hypothetical protein
VKLIASILAGTTAAFIVCAQDASPNGIRVRIAAAEIVVAEAAKAADREFDAWADKLPEGPHELRPDGATDVFDFESVEKNVTINGVGGGKGAVLRGNPAMVPGRVGNGLRLKGSARAVFPEIGRFTRSDTFSMSLWVRLSAVSERVVMIHRTSITPNGGNQGYEVSLENGRVAFGLFHDPAGSAAKVVTRKAPMFGQWLHLAVTYDGSSRAAGMKVFLNGEPSDTEVAADSLRRDIVPEDGSAELTIGFHTGKSGFEGVTVDEFRVFARTLVPIEIASLAGRDDFTVALQAIPQLSPAQRTALLEYYIGTTHQASIDARAALSALRDEERRNANASQRTKGR